MSFDSSIYSALNRYTYQGKNDAISALDWLSTPWRRVFGGRDVCMLSQTNENEMTTLHKTATAFVLIIVFPVGAVSLSALLCKLVTSPYKWEQKKVRAQSEQSRRIFNQFYEAYARNDYDRAIRAFHKRPELAKRSDVNHTLFKIVNRKINSGDPWRDIQDLLPHLKAQDAITLICHAVKTRFTRECESECHLLNANDLISFINSALRNCNLENLTTCYRRLFCDVLHVRTGDNPITNCLKLDLADQMIQDLELKHTTGTTESAQRLNFVVQAMNLRSCLFSGNDNFGRYGMMFRSPNEMRQNNSLLDQIRTINQTGSTQSSRLSSAINISTRPPLERITNGFNNLVNYIGVLQAYAHEDDRNYVNTSRSFASDMSRLLSSVSIHSDVHQLNGELSTIMQRQTNALTRVNEQPTTPLEALQLWKRTRLIHYIEEMKRTLLTETAQVLLEIFPGNNQIAV